MKKRLLAMAALLPLALPNPAQAQGTLRIGMTAADIPLTHGQPDQGFEGNRFTGIPLYDGLTAWDLSRADRASGVIPNLATEWAVDANDRTRWVFRLRPGVTFHDGSAFNADALVWNVRNVLDREAPHFDPRQVGVTATRMPTLRQTERIDDLTAALFTSEPDSLLPINLTNLFMASPTHGEALHTRHPSAEAAWNAFAANPSGTGSFRLTRLVPRERDAAPVRLHAAGVDEALFIRIAHDVGPRAMSPRVRGHVQPQSWFVDLRLPSMAP